MLSSGEDEPYAVVKPKFTWEVPDLSVVQEMTAVEEVIDDSVTCEITGATSAGETVKATGTMAEEPGTPVADTVTFPV